MAMLTRVHDDPAEFLTAAEPFFEADPFSANVIAVVAARVADGASSYDGDLLWAAVEDDAGRVIGVAMCTPPHPLFVSRMPADAAACLAKAFAADGREFPGVNGASDSTSAFAESWLSQTGRASAVARAMRMYRLGTLDYPTTVSGQVTIATAPSDAELVAGWFEEFHEEAMATAPREDWENLARRRIAGREVYLWCDAGKPVSLAAVSAPAAGVARVGPVYTPAEFRRNGYGAAVTAAATAGALKHGAEQVVLYTDLANPVSNSIYQAIGYRPEHDAEERSFL